MPTTAPALARLIWEHPANDGRRSRALAKSVAWQFYKRTIKVPFSLKIYDGLKFRCYPDSHAPGEFIYFGGWPDFEEMTFMRRYLRPGDRFIDCGAHVGQYALLAALLVGRTGEVHAFEAGPLAVTRLVENVRLNAMDQIRIHACAVSDSSGEVSFTVDRARGSGNRIRTAEDAAETTVRVHSVTLDGVLNDNGPYAMAKVDVEGAEPLVLGGARQLLARACPPVWQFELVDKFVRRFGSSVGEFVGVLDRHGYDIARYDADSHRLRYGSELAGTNTDVLAIHRDHRGQVEERLAAAPA